MLYLDDRLPTHPKILKAGALLGPGGASQALHLYLLGLAYARQNLTDGFVPESFVIACGAIPKSGSIGKVLANRTVRLWRKVKGGYQIHDFHQYNPKAAEVKEKRERDRVRKQTERHGRNGNLSMVDISRTRARAVPVPRTYRGRGADAATKSTSTDAARRLAFAREENATTETPSFALACVVMREALQQSWHVDADGSLANVGEHFKALCARRGLAYDAELVRAAYDDVTVAHQRRRDRHRENGSAFSAARASSPARTASWSSTRCGRAAARAARACWRFSRRRQPGTRRSSRRRRRC